MSSMPPVPMNDIKYLGWRQEFSDGGLTLPTRGLKWGFRGTIDAKNLRKNRFSPSNGGLACSDEGAIAPGATPVKYGVDSFTASLPT